MIRGASIAAAIAIVSFAATADARPASQGWYTEGGAGAVAFLPKTNKDAALGPGLGVRIGYDLFSFFSVGISLGASSHEATVPAPPSGEWFQLYRGAADARIGGRFDRLALFIEGGIGAAMISSNILMKVGITDPGQRFSVAFQAGAGGEYQLENRHYAIGLGVDGVMMPSFKPPGGSPAIALDTRLYLRYTY
ncbi:MAG TPA: outer membrane beta-barrel protein [Kofleriaceae bacterium]|jgi:hypothetical protein